MAISEASARSIVTQGAARARRRTGRVGSAGGTRGEDVAWQAFEQTVQRRDHERRGFAPPERGAAGLRVGPPETRARSVPHAFPRASNCRQMRTALAGGRRQPWIQPTHSRTCSRLSVREARHRQRIEPVGSAARLLQVAEGVRPGVKAAESGLRIRLAGHRPVHRRHLSLVNRLA